MEMGDALRAMIAANIDAYQAGLRALSSVGSGAGAREDLYWESVGSGPPVLLIMGLGLSAGAWWRTVPVLARRLRVISFDNRGVGRSPSHTYSYTTEAMADDAASVMDAAGIEDAHVYGISLGGMVAQQLALRHPRRVRSLVLGATHPGGPRAVAPESDVLDFLRRRPDMQHEEAAWASVPYNYGPRCRRRQGARIAEDIAHRLAHPFPADAYRAQLYAAALHNCHGRLDRVEVPTLVVHGRHDRLIPVANAELLADQIPTARLEILEQSGHLYPTEQPDIDETISAFVEEVEGSDASR
jgi:3-oxoadipate enol-lactonase